MRERLEASAMLRPLMQEFELFIVSSKRFYQLVTVDTINTIVIINNTVAINPTIR